MGQRVASGQITIVDLNDGRAVQAYTSTSKGETQIYNPDTKVYTPAYSSSSPQTVTAKVYVSGISADQAPTSACTGWAWKVNGTAVGTSGNYTFANNVLSIKADIATGTKYLNIEWECTYTDPDTGAQTKVLGYKTLALSQSGGAAGLVVFELPNGDTFDKGSAITSLTAKASLMRGATKDTTIKSAAWEKLDITTGTWKAATETNSLTGGVSTITVTANDVLNFQTYRVTFTDSENTSETFTGYVTFMDATDPYIVYVRSTTGDKIVNGAGSTEVYAEVWLDGKMVETKGAASPQFTYTWTKYNQNGVATNWSGTTSPTKTGNPITVTAADVNVRATIYCDVAKK
ncbi:MAG: hypothetical protein J6C95_00575 [Muribaculaceae bacterium]|nr:hypothetical protein [Muribaculaceae bacterium]